ncbi:MAG: GNAT family N-acetyltransferase [Clostridia bacterium]|nr:GNAT family N-acetyltransferase [Clostridia bacterium]
MLIRKTEERDLSEIGNIYSAAKQFMKQNGNPNQWRTDYPSKRTAREDMERGIGYVCEDGGEVVAVFAFAPDREPTYDTIYDGAWQNDAPYAFIHRVAVKKHGQGIIDFCLAECYRMHPNLRIDTHRDNLPMQKVLLRSGFVRSGIIYLSNGDERIAFHKI